MSSKPKETMLTPKQKMFAAEYLIDLNATQAAIRAGYSAKTAQEQGSRLLSNVMVQHLIQEGMDQRAEKAKVTSEYVLNTIVDTIERCRQAKPVYDKAGNPVMVFNENEQTIAPMYAFDSSAVLRGAELLGKHLKLFTDKTELSGDMIVNVVTGVPRE